jgi:regulatory protein
MQPKNIGTEKAYEKIRHYCAYQERCHYEVREKLYSFGLYKDEVELLISQLIEEKYLDEERYAIAFAGGKFRIKHWGRVKIKYALKQNKLSDYCIKTALNSIDGDEYEKVLKALLEAKLKTLKSEKNLYIRNRKLQSYLMQKGFEADLISGLLKKN